MKRLLAGLVALAFAGGLSACGSDSAGEGATQEERFDFAYQQLTEAFDVPWTREDTRDVLKKGCEMVRSSKDAGMTSSELVSEFASMGSMTVPQTELVLGAAIAVYCPSFQDWID